MGLIFCQPGLITKAEGQRPFPCVTLQKTASFFLDFRVQPHVSFIYSSLTASMGMWKHDLFRFGRK